MRHGNEKIMRSALRLARLAALDAPSIIIAGAASDLHERVRKACAVDGVDIKEEAERNATLLARLEEEGPLSAEEEAELQREEDAYDIAATKAKDAAGYSDIEWDRLDHSYRFELVMENWVEPTP